MSLDQSISALTKKWEALNSALMSKNSTQGSFSGRKRRSTQRSKKVTLNLALKKRRAQLSAHKNVALKEALKKICCAMTYFFT